MFLYMSYMTIKCLFFFLLLTVGGGGINKYPRSLKNGYVGYVADGAPKLGWHDTLAYLTIPVILVITQSVSMKIMQPAKDPNAPVDESQQASQNVSARKMYPLVLKKRRALF